jgi:lipid A disaccharide synthetase
LSGIAADTPLRLILPGSRTGAVKRRLPMFVEAAKGLPDYKVVILCSKYPKDDRTIDVLKTTVQKAKLGQSEELAAIKAVVGVDGPTASRAKVGLSHTNQGPPQ